MAVCGTCGCSLVRLGVPADRQASTTFEGLEYRFCCKRCLEVFAADPARYVQETAGLVVCPTCLAEKPVSATVGIDVDGKEVRFCRCPHCVTAFRSNPTFYLERLRGEVQHTGSLVTSGCC